MVENEFYNITLKKKTHVDITQSIFFLGRISEVNYFLLCNALGDLSERGTAPLGAILLCTLRLIDGNMKKYNKQSH